MAQAMMVSRLEKKEISLHWSIFWTLETAGQGRIIMSYIWELYRDGREKK